MDNTKFGWLNIGTGISGFGLSAGLIPSFHIGNKLYSIRYIGGMEISFEGPTPIEGIHDFGLLYGKIYRNLVFLCTASIGIGIISGTRRGKFLESGEDCRRHERIDFQNIGIPCETQLFIGGNHIGVGCHIFGNLNTERSY